MLGKHIRKAIIAATGLAVVFSLSACDGEDSGSSGSAAPSSSSSGSQSTGSGGSDGSGSGAGGNSGSGTNSDTGAGGQADGTDGGGSASGDQAATCRTDRMEVTAVDNSTDDASGVVTVSLKNTGSAPCRVNGYAGADLKTADGDTLSPDRNGDAASAAVLQSGEQAAFNIYHPVNASGGSGVRVTAIVVTAPNDTTQATVAWPGGSLPVTDGSGGGALTIGPVGKVG